jgi:MFS family permease
MPPKRPTYLRIPFYLAALRSANYRLWFVGQSTSLIGTWMQTVAQQWVVYSLTGSKVLLGLVTFANSLPTVLFLLPSGVLADRFSRRRIMYLTQTTMMVLAFILAGLLAAGLLEIWHLMVLAFLLGVANALDAPARQAFAVEIIEDRSDLPNAIALNSTIFNLGRVLGPALAGWILAVWGPVWCFTLNGVSFLAVLGALLMMRFPLAGPSPSRTVSRNVREGLDFALRHPVILPVMLLVGCAALFTFSFSPLMPAYAAEVLAVDERGLGLLVSAVGLGALMGSLVVIGFSRTGRQGTVFRAGAWLYPISVVTLAVSRSFPLSMILLLMAGFGLVIQNASANTIIQSSVSDSLRGRVMSVYLMIFFGAVTVGALLAGFVSQLVGVAAGIALCAGIGLSGVFFLHLAYPKLRQI